ncbi:glycosyltransferase family 9 protein [Nocardia xishanensis]|uniref:glycosyltransferase family 9 protein n=1 Tax=Nocardia xishanensis TaxID=238964 RepID=UPI0033CD949F
MIAAATHSILVLRALGLGDLLTIVPAVRGLRNAYPEHRVVLAAPEALRPLADLIDAVDELLPTARLGALRWQAAPPRLAVNMHGSGPESIRDLLATRPETLLTHRHPEFADLPGPEWRDDMHEVDRWCRLLEWGGIAADRTALMLPAPPESATERNVVVIHPGAAYPARRWPSERFAQVARELEADGHRVVITGTRGEIGLANAVAEKAGLSPSSVYAGRTDLAQLAALVAAAELVVCGDTGVGHLATAFGTPSVLLFGPTPPHRWGPPGAARRHVALWSGDIGDPHADRPDPGLLTLRPEQVLSAATGLLDGRVRHG